MINGNLCSKGGSSGLVVTEDDSCLRVHEFESLILDGHDIFSRWFVVEIVMMFVWKDRKYISNFWKIFYIIDNFIEPSLVDLA